MKQRGTKTKWKGQGKCEGLRSRMRGKRLGIRGPQEVWRGGGGRERVGGLRPVSDNRFPWHHGLCFCLNMS